MITLITGLPGHGKTLYSIGLLLEEVQKDRMVYSDINELQIPGVHQSPDDWTETPNGSLVLYDECQRRYPTDSRGGRSSDETIAAMETHRHTAHDIVLITQDPRLLHAHVRRLVGMHHHVVRIFGTQTAKVYTMERVLKTDSTSDLEKADAKVWAYPKEHYQYYKSAVDHTVKPRIPRKLIWIGGLAASALVMTLGFTMNAKTFFTPDQMEQGVQTETIAETVIDTINDWTHLPGMGDVSGCVSSATACQCYNGEGIPINLEQDHCRTVVDRPLPIRINNSGRG